MGGLGEMMGGIGGALGGMMGQMANNPAMGMMNQMGMGGQMNDMFN